jgi:uncharacterized protein YndB with AHSA1/START domain
MPTLESAPITAANIFLEQHRIIRAPRARVYEAWTNPEILKTWFGSASRYCPSATLDVRVGGAYRIEVAPNEPAAAATGEDCATRTTAAFGAYTKIVPDELLQFTWASDWVPGEESLVTVTFEDARGGTQVNIRHERFATEQSRDAHNTGWANCLDKLESRSDKLQ